VFAFGCLLASGAAGQEAERRPRRPLIVVLRRAAERENALLLFCAPANDKRRNYGREDRNYRVAASRS
jgi:hypothetical protein